MSAPLRTEHSGRMGTISVFCSYAREDEAYRRELEDRLAPIRAERIIDDWYDNQIQPGARWGSEIATALDRARLVIFIVSPDLVASSYVTDVELPKSLELERTGRAQIVPIIVRETDWGGSPLAAFQALPRGARPIEAFDNRDAAYANVVDGLRAVCKRIVDWENPYRRAQVGDWTYAEQTMVLPDGRSLTGQGTEELVEKSATQAVLEVDFAIPGQRQQKTLTVDLTQPFEDRMGEMMNQAGAPVPPNLEMRVGPSQYDDEVLFIGGKRYETIRARRDVTLALRGESQSGSISIWRSIDVPLYGTVKGTSELPGMRQNQVLLDSGHGDASTRKPTISAGDAPPPLFFGPGHWHLRMAAMGGFTDFDLMLHPNGMLQGAQAMMGSSVPLQGQWGYDPSNHVVTLHMVAIMMGMPAGQNMLQMQITGQDGPRLSATNPMGQQFLWQRVG